jgi:hypothetical protein
VVLLKSLKIESSKIRLAINDDKNKIIEFDPNDVKFINRYYSMISNFEVKQKEFAEKAAKIDKITTYNSIGMKVSDIEGSKLMLEMCEYMKGQIDYVFGNGASEKAFGDTINPEMINEFLGGVAEYIAAERNAKIEKYTGKNTKSVAKK